MSDSWQRYIFHLIQTAFHYSKGNEQVRMKFKTKPFKARVSVRFSLKSRESDDLVLLLQSQVAWLLLLLDLPLSFQCCVPKLRVCLVVICSALLSVLRTLSVVWMYILLHSLASMFRRGATQQASVLHPWVQTKPVHYVVDAENQFKVSIFAFVWMKRDYSQISYEDPTCSHRPRGFVQA